MIGGAQKHLLHESLTPTDAGKRCINVGPVFPEIFASCCLLLFSPPVVKAVYLAVDPLVSYWFGSRPLVIVILPLVFIGVSYFLHVRRRAPRRIAIALGLIGPSVVLGVQGNNIAVNSLRLTNSFGASDCQSYVLKHKLEEAWQTANAFHESCLAGKGGEKYLIQNCEDYPEQAFKHSGWDFLGDMEQRFACAGWCHHREPMWIASTTTDACGTVVSQVLSAKVFRDALQIIIYSFIMLTMSTVSLILLGPSMSEKGFDW